MPNKYQNFVKIVSPNVKNAISVWKKIAFLNIVNHVNMIS